ncbi:NAD-dependent epimerase/dehydratase family protein [Shewanella sp. AS1]|uniref:NAD-dependent epimerase/dehydratase family protein n=1 Tax=Shewanella sp. AS1 TaxID=2907626 RepID=UPI001F360D74|nr:NAD-dependent epimerase/dehydratase family protein [Shewanella sp. AS1]MCE9680053.1 NAD-dependent epimerase/dehydratase family protein [Shewanella sp. AS1]
MKVFLTGGAGMLGSNIKSAFLKYGTDIIAPSKEELDLFDFEKVRQFIAHHKPTLIIHAAGLVGGIRQNIQQPYEFCFVNLQIGLNVLHAAFVEGVPSLINISSANVYPDGNLDYAMSESDILSGKINKDTEGYGLAKTCVLKLANYLSLQYGVCYKSLIPCNLYGKGDSFDKLKAHMIPAIIRRLHEAKVEQVESVEIWGDGSARREFLFAEDLAEYIYEVSSHLQELPQNLNLAPEVDFSVLDYNRIVAEIVGYHGDFHFDETKPVGTKVKRLNTSLARQHGWDDTTSIKDGISKTYQYFLEKVAL